MNLHLHQYAMKVVSIKNKNYVKVTFLDTGDATLNILLFWRKTNVHTLFS